MPKTRIPISLGVTFKPTGDFAQFYPQNIEIIAKELGSNQGYAIQHSGLTHYIDGNGIDRGGINWNGRYFRVSGNDLIEINNDGTKTIRGSIPGSSLCRFDYSFDSLSISNGENLYYYSNEKKMQTASINNFGQVIDHKFMDGYFFTTDGANIIQSDLTDKTKANPLKYGSSELDPDNIVALQRIRGELYALNRHTIEVFDNVGGEGFVLQRINGAQIMKGCIGVNANAIYNDNLVFVGGGRGEKIGIYIAGGGQTKKISTIDIDDTINGLSEYEKRNISIDVKTGENGSKLYIHAPKFSYLYDDSINLWTILKSNDDGFRGKNIVLWNGKWHCGDSQSNKLGFYDNESKDHYGERVNYELKTMLLDNDGTGFIINEVELQAVSSNYTKPSSIGLSISKDNGVTFGRIAYKTIKPGKHDQRFSWFKNGMVRNNAVIRFNWNSDAIITVVKLLVNLELLS